ncbi:MAG: YihY/virulence factor BrkB family protein [Chloroflexi bacterium]|nr:YihY/virulence factor BrkB family protein [Chloroflexota bacterium]
MHATAGADRRARLFIGPRPWPAILYLSVRAYLDRGCYSHAAAIAFHASFAIFPMLLALAALLATFDESGQVYRRLLTLAESNLNLDLSILPEKSVFSPAGTPAALALAAAALIWTALQIVSAARRGLEAAWRVPNRSFLADFGAELGGSLAMLAIAILAGGLISLLELPRLLIGEVFGRGDMVAVFESWLYRGLVEVLSVALAFAATWVLYLILAGRSSNARTSLPGAIFFAASIPVLKIGFWAYFELFDQFEVIYGSIASFVAVLLWIFLIAHVFLLGGVISEVASGSSPVAERASGAGGS